MSEPKNADHENSLNNEVLAISAIPSHQSASVQREVPQAPYFLQITEKGMANDE